MKDKARLAQTFLCFAKNIQLIRDKVLSIKGIQDIITTTKIPLKRIESNDLLIKQGDIENTMYVVKTGQFSIARNSTGGDIHLAEAEAGDVIGEMSLIKEGVRSANVKAEKAGVENVLAELSKHNTSPVLWKAKSAVVARQGISLNDLTVALVMGHSR